MARLHLIDPDTLPAMRRLWDEGLCDPAWARQTDTEKRKVCRVCPVRALCEHTGRAGNETGEIWGGWSGTDSHTASRCSKGHPLSGDNLEILANGQRRCRRCAVAAVRRARARRKKDRCRNGHRFTPENTARDSQGFRICRACHRDIQARYAEKCRARAAANSITVTQQRHRDALTNALKKKKAA